MMQKLWVRVVIQTVRVAIVLVALFLLFAITCYRTPVGEPELVKSEILGDAYGWFKGDPIRSRFESIIGRRKLSLVDHPKVYVTDADFERCWPETWSTMREKNYTFEVTLKVSHLRFHEEPLAEVIALDTLDKAPITIK